MSTNKGTGKGKASPIPAMCPSTWNLALTDSRRAIVPTPLMSVEKLVASHDYQAIDDWAFAAKDAVTAAATQAKKVLARVHAQRAGEGGWTPPITSFMSQLNQNGAGSSTDVMSPNAEARARRAARRAVSAPWSSSDGHGQSPDQRKLRRGNRASQAIHLSP